MKVLKMCLLFVVCSMLLIGCSNEKIRNLPIYQKANKIHSLVESGKWDSANEASKSIETMYKDQKWKYQLLGDESEYNGLIQEIAQLQVAVEEQDKKEAKLHIALIKNYLKAMYFK